MIIPPKIGIAIGIMISLPFPVDVNTGKSANMVVTVVIRHGRILLPAASNVACRIPFISLGFSLSKVWVKYVAITTPSSVAIPNRAIKPTQTATLKLMVFILKSVRRFSPNKLKLKNQSCPYNHIIMNPPAKATAIPVNTISEVETDLN